MEAGHGQMVRVLLGCRGRQGCVKFTRRGLLVFAQVHVLLVANHWVGLAGQKQEGGRVLGANPCVLSARRVLPFQEQDTGTV